MALVSVLRPPVAQSVRTRDVLDVLESRFVDRSPCRCRRDAAKASICARAHRCTGSWPRTSRCESGGNQRSLSSLLRRRRDRGNPRAGVFREPWSWDTSPGSGGTRLPLCLDDTQPIGFPIGRTRDRGNRCLKRRHSRAFGPRPADDEQVPAHLLGGRPLTPRQHDNPFSAQKTLKTLRTLPASLGASKTLPAIVSFCRSFFLVEIPPCRDRDGCRHHRAFGWQRGVPRRETAPRNPCRRFPSRLDQPGPHRVQIQGKAVANDLQTDAAVRILIRRPRPTPADDGSGSRLVLFARRLSAVKIVP